MEVCGTHTVSLRRSGIHSLLPESVRLISGPGCPVCVTPTGYIDNALMIAESGEAVVVTFGDMLKVPGSRGTCLSRYSSIGSVRVVYSPNEILSIREETGRPIVFLGIGFETTTPTVAASFLRVIESGISEVYLYPSFKTVPPALEALLASPDICIDGFLLPGHVSVIIGAQAYGMLEHPNGRPGVVAGFEPLDMLSGILTLLELIREGHPRVVNAYSRAVRPEGNLRAQATVATLLEPCDDLWRGLGTVPGSGLRLKEEVRRIDAASAFSLPPLSNQEPRGCLCSHVLLGRAHPRDCRLFGTACVPEQPVGPCMVSSEGSCAAELRYGG